VAGGERVHRGRAGRVGAHRAGTRLADAAGGVTDEAWANAAKHYDDEQLGALVALIAGINAWNRINVITRQPAGDYQPGQFG
jgi:alkylhydroperoxidase family enzyme